MNQFDWVHLPYQEALTHITKVALARRQELQKEAQPDPKNVSPQPEPGPVSGPGDPSQDLLAKLQLGAALSGAAGTALSGAGVGGLLGLGGHFLRDEKERKRRGLLSDVLGGAALGSGVGLGGGLAVNSLAGNFGKRAAPEWLNKLQEQAGQGWSAVQEQAGKGYNQLREQADKGLGPLQEQFQKAIPNEHLQKGLMGLGAGGVLGLGRHLFRKNKRGRLLQDLLTGATLGGAAGTGLSLGYEKLMKGPDANRQVDPAEIARTILGPHGPDKASVEKTLQDLKEGKISRELAETQLRGAMPGKGDQIAAALPNAWNRLGNGNGWGILDAYREGDVLGTKNVVPGLGHFSLPTAGASLSGAIAGNRLGAAYDQVRANRALLTDHFQGNTPLPNTTAAQLSEKFTPGQLQTLENARMTPGKIRFNWLGGMKPVEGPIPLAPAEGLTGEQIGWQANRLRTTPGAPPRGNLYRNAGTALGALIPMLAAEWASPSSYRAYDPSIQKALDQFPSTPPAGGTP